jgi:hypothetical protein
MMKNIVRIISLPLYVLPAIYSLNVLAVPSAPKIDEVVVTADRLDNTYRGEDTVAYQTAVLNMQYGFNTPIVPLPAPVVDTKEEFCKGKAQAVAEADAKAGQCKADAKTKGAAKKNDCSSITKVTINFKAQAGLGATLDIALSRLNIKPNAIINTSADGTIEWSPREDCRLKIDDEVDAAGTQCDATANTTKSKYASCP